MGERLMFLIQNLGGQNSSLNCRRQKGKKHQITLKQNQLGFTYCQVPIVYTKLDREGIEITFENGDIKEIQGNRLNKELSAKIFNRNNEIKLIKFSIKNL